MDPEFVTLVILALTIALFILNKLSVGVVAILCSLALVATGVVDTGTALSGFGDPVVIFIASLFVVAEGLDASGITGWMGTYITDRAGASRATLLAVIMIVTAVLSAFITPNGAAAAMIPVVLKAARASGIQPSLLLMPVAFAASAGALLTLSGSVVNVMVSQTLFDQTGRSFGFFEFAGAGLLLVVGSIAVALTMERLLPRDREASISRDFGAHLGTLLDHYQIDQGFFRLRIEREIAATARSLETDGVHVYAVQRGVREARGLDDALVAGDIVLMTGDAATIRDIAKLHGFWVESEPLVPNNAATVIPEQSGLAEVIVAPRSMLIGQPLFAGLMRGGVTVLAARRGGREIGASTLRAAEGDVLLVHGEWDAIFRLEDDDDVVLVDCPAEMRRQMSPLGVKAIFAGGITLVMVIMLALGLVEPALAGLMAAGAMVLTGVVTPPEAYRAISWQTVVLIGGLIPLSVAIRESGAADLIADGVVALTGSGGQTVVLAVVFIATALLGQVISNTATALVMIPIAVVIAQTSGIDLPVMLMSLAVAAGASLLTPIATPANLMVGAAAGYRFGDYWRFGLANMAVWFIVAVLVVPLIW